MDQKQPAASEGLGRGYRGQTDPHQRARGALRQPDLRPAQPVRRADPGARGSDDSVDGSGCVKTR
jgi:hypothetical protein